MLLRVQIRVQVTKSLTLRVFQKQRSFHFEEELLHIVNPHIVVTREPKCVKYGAPFAYLSQKMRMIPVLAIWDIRSYNCSL